MRQLGSCVGNDANRRNVPVNPPPLRVREREKEGADVNLHDGNEVPTSLASAKLAKGMKWKDASEEYLFTRSW